MANPLQHAKTTQEKIQAEVKAYLPEIFSRLAQNYGIMAFGLIIISTVIGPILAQFIPAYLVNSLAFAANLLWLIFAWRFFENRNKATALYSLYVRYSRQRRELESLVKEAEAQTLDNTDKLYTSVDYLEEAAQSFLAAVKDAGVKARS